MNDAPVTAVILAAGEGNRLDPLTNRRPKPMIPMANQTPDPSRGFELVCASGASEMGCGEPR